MALVAVYHQGCALWSTKDKIFSLSGGKVFERKQQLALGWI